MKIYPYELPEGVHPFSKFLLGFGLTVEQVQALARHLGDDLGCRVLEDHTRRTFSWVVGWPGEYPDHERVEVGDELYVSVADFGAVRVVEGALPPGLALDKALGRLVGAFTHPGLYSVTVEVGPAVKYDPLGTPGGPTDAGMWTPWGQPYAEVETRLDEFPATVADLDDADKDRLLAELLAERDSRALRGENAG